MKSTVNNFIIQQMNNIYKIKDNEYDEFLNDD